MEVRIAPGWKTQLELEFQMPYFKYLVTFLKEAYQKNTVYPPAHRIFHAFDLCDFVNTRVVILGQDPYHGPGQADGLCFSVPQGKRIPPSLMNIFQEIKEDLGKSIPLHGDLTRWAKQGVLLLNATLTVYAGQPGSHQKKGWEMFTDAVINTLAQSKIHISFLLWGNYARQKAALIDATKHLVLTSPHPSPYSADKGFFGNKHFSQTNAYLAAHGHQPIDW